MSSQFRWSLVSAATTHSAATSWAASGSPVFRALFHRRRRCVSPPDAQGSGPRDLGRTLGRARTRSDQSAVTERSAPAAFGGATFGSLDSELRRRVPIELSGHRQGLALLECFRRCDRSRTRDAVESDPGQSPCPSAPVALPSQARAAQSSSREPRHAWHRGPPDRASALAGGGCDGDSEGRRVHGAPGQVPNAEGARRSLGRRTRRTEPRKTNTTSATPRM
jgi:hypothetical protein